MWARRDSNRPRQTKPRKPIVDRKQTFLLRGQIADLVAGYNAGGTIEALAKQFSINRTTVMRHLDRQAVARRKIGLNADDIRKAVALYDSGLSLAEVGQLLHVDPETIRRHLIKIGSPIRRRRGRKGTAEN